MRFALGSGSGGGGGGGGNGRGEVALGHASSKSFTMHASLRGPDVTLDGTGAVSGTGLALGCAPVEQVESVHAA